MRKHLLLAALLWFFCSDAYATEWGILALPKHMSEMKPQDFADAITTVREVPAPLNITLLTWHDLEPKEGTFDATRIGGFTYALKQGMSGYFGISPINTTKRDLADDLADMAWTDPKMIERFNRLVENVSKELPADLPYFVIGNEVDVYFEKHPEETGPYLAFYRQAREVVKQHFPHAVVGITVTYEGLTKEKRKDILPQIIAESDAAFFTFYPIIDLKPVPVATTPALLDQIIAAASGKDVLLQEVGFASSEAIGSSQAMQQEFFKTIIPAIHARPQIKLASIFALHDMDPKICDMFTEYYGGNSWMMSLFLSTEKFKGFLCTLGLKDADGNPKPAWDTVVSQIRQASSSEQVAKP